MNFADDSCRLARYFGEGDERSVLYFERYSPSDGFMLVVAKKSLDEHTNYVSFRFDPGKEEPREREVEVGKLGDLVPALIFTTTTLMPIKDMPENGNARRDFSRDRAIALEMRDKSSPELESAVHWLEIELPRGQKVRYALGSMIEPMADMRQCTDELIIHWGVDV